jgi:hypothetical protein
MMKTRKNPRQLLALSVITASQATTTSKKVSARGTMLKHDLPDFNAGIVLPLQKALKRKKFSKLVRLLLHGTGQYYGNLWNPRFRNVTARYIKQAYVKPLKTIVRKILDGKITTVEELQLQLVEILGVVSNKYTTKSYALDRPKLGYGKPRQRQGHAQAQKDLIVSGLPLADAAEDRGARPDESLVVDELMSLVTTALASLDPLEVAIFEAVQNYRDHDGLSGAYPSVARRLILDAAGQPVELGAVDMEPTTPTRELRRFVRLAFLKVRTVLVDRAAAAGYPVPVIRRSKKKRTSRIKQGTFSKPQ